MCEGGWVGGVVVYGEGWVAKTICVKEGGKGGEVFKGTAGRVKQVV